MRWLGTALLPGRIAPGIALRDNSLNDDPIIGETFYLAAGANRLSFSASELWAYAIAQSQLDYVGKLDLRQGSSDPSGETDQVLMFSEQHLRQRPSSCVQYYNEVSHAPIVDKGRAVRLKPRG